MVAVFCSLWWELSGTSYMQWRVVGRRVTSNDMTSCRTSSDKQWHDKMSNAVQWFSQSTSGNTSFHHTPKALLTELMLFTVERRLSASTAVDWPYAPCLKSLLFLQYTCTQKEETGHKWFHWAAVNRIITTCHELVRDYYMITTCYVPRDYYVLRVTMWLLSDTSYYMITTCYVPRDY